MFDGAFSVYGFLASAAPAAEAVSGGVDPFAAFIAFLTLATLEIILGIDNIVFISILAGKLPKHQQPKAIRLGLAVAMISRIVLLFFISWIVAMEADVFVLFGTGFSVKDLILIAGGLFLLFKSVREIHHKMEGDSDHHESGSTGHASMQSVLIQVMVIDLVFSIDSVITAVGMTDILAIMIAAVIASVGVMMLFAGPVARFVETHPTIKVLALSFLMLIGVLLVAEGFEAHLNRNYIYFAMGFALAVELINMKVRSKKSLTRKIVDGKQPKPAKT